jgi:hypothetical protein
MSQTASAGFDGVSTHTIVAPSQAATIASVSVGTNRTSTPRGASRSFATPRTPGYPSCTATRTSPARSAGSSTAHTAAIPEENSTLSASSRPPSAASSAVHVGLASRP